MTFKVGDKVALVGTPNVLFGVITKVKPEIDWCDIQVHNSDGSKAYAARRASDGHVISGSWPDLTIVPWIDPAPPKPKFLVLTPKGHQFHGEEITTGCGEIRLENFSDNNPRCGMNMLAGDTVYKRVGKVVREYVTKEIIPVEVGYRFGAGKRLDGVTFESEVIAIKGDYAFVQTYRNGEPTSCSCCRISSIPKQTRDCSKYINKLVKE